MTKIKSYLPGLILTAYLAYFSNFISIYLPGGLISPSVIALLIGISLNPLASKFIIVEKGINFTSKTILKLAIILMGATLSFSQVLSVGKISLIVMIFTLTTAFGGGYLLGRLFKMDWKLSSLISAGTGVCGASAIAALAPTINAKSKDVAYAISATFLFDILMVILFPILGRYFLMSDLGFGLWAGTAINDTSSVVAASYAFSDAAGSFAIIVKLTRTLSIIPIVIIFAFINQYSINKNDKTQSKSKLDLKKIVPWFILLFLVMVAFKSTGLISDQLSRNLALISKFMMVMALGAIGLKTNLKAVLNLGYLPMLFGFIISLLVVVVAFMSQMILGQL